MKIKTLLAAALVAIATTATAQLTVPTQDQLQKFLKTKTIIVLEANPLRAFNRQMEETAKKHWTITPYEFMVYDSKVFDSLRRDPNLSFLMLDNIYYKKDKELVKYQFLNVVLGGNYETVKEMPTISGLPISYADVDEGTYDYKLGLILRFIESHVHNLMEHPEITSSSKALKFYANNLKRIHDKTLYLTQSELAPEVNSTKKIKQFYPFNVQIVEPSKIEEIIDSNDPTAVILHQVAPEKGHKKIRCWNTILGADDAAMYYFNWFIIKQGKRPQGIGAKDFKKLAK